MKPFTLSIYEAYVRVIKKAYTNILRFDEFMAADTPPNNFCLIRHDVDRKPQNALAMAELEASLGLTATYYFRAKSNTFKPDIIQKIAGLGHEIGYHYESLSDTNGDMEKALEDFALNLQKFRQIATIKTISMHGRPLKPHDNRDIWRVPENHQLLKSKFDIFGEVYLDIDYKNIAYINDTGRNWTANKANRRDHVDSTVAAHFESDTDLLDYLKNTPHPKMVFQIHPERWTDHKVEYALQASKDHLINFIKKFV